eukprot:222136-Amphidinium_carterae.1
MSVHQAMLHFGVVRRKVPKDESTTSTLIQVDNPHMRLTKKMRQCKMTDCDFKKAFCGKQSLAFKTVPEARRSYLLTMS